MAVESDDRWLAHSNVQVAGALSYYRVQQLVDKKCTHWMCLSCGRERGRIRSQTLLLSAECLDCSAPEVPR